MYKISEWIKLRTLILRLSPSLSIQAVWLIYRFNNTRRWKKEKNGAENQAVSSFFLFFFFLKSSSKCFVSIPGDLCKPTSKIYIFGKEGNVCIFNKRVKPSSEIFLLSWCIKYRERRYPPCKWHYALQNSPEQFWVWDSPTFESVSLNFINVWETEPTRWQLEYFFKVVV